MSERVERRVLITGANRGLGFAVARAFAAKGHSLIVTARDDAKASRLAQELRDEHPSADLTSCALDLASLASVNSVAGALVKRDNPIDIVLHNAGMLFPPQAYTQTDAGVEETLQVHAVAPLLLSHALKPTMARPSRTWIVGSSLHLPGSRGPEVNFRHDDPNSERGYNPEVVYKNTKLAALWVAFEWERRFGAVGLHADVLSPGFVPATAADRAGSWLMRWSLKHVLPRMPFATSVDDATAEIVRLLTTTSLEERGGRYFRNGESTDSSPQSRDEEQARQFWDWACARAGIEQG